MMKYLFNLLLFPIALIWPAGCLEFPESREDSAVHNIAAPGLEDALWSARNNLLEAEVLESLRTLAGEHVRNDLLLSLPAAREEVLSGGEVRRSQLLRYLDNVIAYNQLLSGSGRDLGRRRRPRVRELFDCAQSSLWIGLGAVNEELALSATPELRRRKAELELELRVSTGLPASAVEAFRYDTLPQPRRLVLDLAVLQQTAAFRRSESHLAGVPADFPERVRSRCGGRADAGLVLAEALLRLPARLVEAGKKSESNAALGSAAGVAFQVELSVNALREAWDYFEQAQRKLELEPESRINQIALIHSRAAWQLAYVRLLADLGGGAIPEKAPEGRELPPEAIAEFLEIFLPEAPLPTPADRLP